MIDFAAAREAMVDRQVRTADVTLYPIIEAMLAVPREDFVPAALAAGRLPRRARADRARPGAARPAGVRQAARRARTRGRATSCSTSAAATATRPRCSARMAEAVVALEEDPGLAAEAERLLAAQSVDNAVVQTGPLAAGDPGHGPFDAMIVEGAVEALPEAIVAQVKPGGRDRRDLRRRRRRPGPARAPHRGGARPGGVSSMPRRRCFPASPRRKRLSSDPIRPIVPARKPGDNGPFGAESAGG